MSDTPESPDWWQASDAKWYPPETHPDHRPAVPPPPPPGATSPSAPAWGGAAAPPGVSSPEGGIPMPAAPAQQVSGLGRALNVIFISWLVLGVATLANLFVERSLINDIRERPFSVSFSDLEASDDRTAALASILLILTVVTAIVFLIWMNKSYKNLQFFGATSLRRSTGWSVGGWFIPFANLVIPYQAMRDIWVGSDLGRTEPYGEGWWQQGSAGALVKWWWGLWILSGALSWQTFVRGEEETADEVLMTNTLEIANEVVGMVVAVAALLLVKQVTERQRARAAASGTAV